ncbi:MAG: hypothetical protein ACQETH_02425 [Candidatus Rifleibacteriota bacterium]
MASSKNLKTLLFLAVAIAGSFCPGFAGEFEFTVEKSGNNDVLIRFAETLSLDTVVFPVYNKELWGERVKCRAVVLKCGNRKILGSAGNDQKEIVFKLGGLLAEQIFVSPVYLEKNVDGSGGSIKLNATRGVTRQIEDEIAALTLEVNAFQRRHNCFSCHTALPLALLIDQAEQKKFKTPKAEVRHMLKKIEGLQKADGSYNFASQPDYGTITPTLCAGAVFSLLSNIGYDIETVLTKIVTLFPDWRDEKGYMGSDFFFRPLMVGRPASALFEAFTIAGLYYPNFLSLSTQQRHNYRKRLAFIIKNFKSDPSLNPATNLLFLTGLPYIGQFDSSERQKLEQQLFKFVKTDSKTVNIEVLGLLSIVFSRLNFQPGIEYIEKINLQPQNLSEKIWHCLIDVTLNNP